jgi:hypothetical protein
MARLVRRDPHKVVYPGSIPGAPPILLTKFSWDELNIGNVVVTGSTPVVSSTFGRMMELADMMVLETIAFVRAGSTPATATILHSPHGRWKNPPLVFGSLPD